MEKDTEFYSTYVYFIFAEGEFYPIGGGKGKPEFEERIKKIKKSLEEKNYKTTQSDIEVRKDSIIVWNCPKEEELKSFMDAIFRLLKKIDHKIDISLSLDFPPSSKATNSESIINKLWEIKKDSIRRTHNRRRKKGLRTNRW